MNNVISQTAFIKIRIYKNIQFKIYHSQHYTIARCWSHKNNSLTCICLYNFLQLNLTIIGFGFMVFNATFNNISVTLWQSVILVGETGLSREIHRPIASDWQILSHKVSSPSRHEQDSNSQLQLPYDHYYYYDSP